MQEINYQDLMKKKKEIEIELNITIKEKDIFDLESVNKSLEYNS